MGIQEFADDHEASSAVRGVILSALGIGRAMVLCNNAELVNPCKSRRNGRRRSGVCQTPATAKKKKPDGFPRNGRKGQNQRIPLPTRVCGIYCYLTQARQEFDAIDRPVRHFLDAGAHTRDIEQQESKGHKTGHPDDLPEDLLQSHGHDARAQC